MALFEHQNSNSFGKPKQRKKQKSLAQLLYNHPTSQDDYEPPEINPTSLDAPKTSAPVASSLQPAVQQTPEDLPPPAPTYSTLLGRELTFAEKLYDNDTSWEPGKNPHRNLIVNPEAKSFGQGSGRNQAPNGLDHVVQIRASREGARAASQPDLSAQSTDLAKSNTQIAPRNEMEPVDPAVQVLDSLGQLTVNSDDYDHIVDKETKRQQIVGVLTEMSSNPEDRGGQGNMAIASSFDELSAAGEENFQHYMTSKYNDALTTLAKYGDYEARQNLVGAKYPNIALQVNSIPKDLPNSPGGRVQGVRFSNENRRPIPAN